MKTLLIAFIILLILPIISKGQVGFNIIAPKGYVYLTNEQFERAEKYKADAIFYHTESILRDSIIKYQAIELQNCGKEFLVSTKIIKKQKWKILKETAEKYGGWLLSVGLAGKLLKFY